MDSRSIVWTVRRVAAGLETYVGSVVGTMSQEPGARMTGAATGSASGTSTGSTTRSSTDSVGVGLGLRGADLGEEGSDTVVVARGATEVRRAAARSPLTMTRQATSQATSRVAGAGRPTAR